MTQFPKMHEEAVAADQPYSAYALDRISQRNNWLIENRGNSMVVTARGAGSDPLSGVHERPFVSISGYSSILQIPWWVAPTLSGFTVRGLVRVSDAKRDLGQTSTDPGVTFRAHMLTNANDGRLTVTPTIDGAGDAGWRTFELTYDLGSFLGATKAGFYDTLAIQLKSRLFDYVDQGAGLDGMFANEERDTGAPYLPNRVKVKSNTTMYADDTASVAPEPGHWTTCCGVAYAAPTLSASDPDKRRLFVFDHVAKPHSTFSGSDRVMYVWPWKQALAEPYEGDNNGVAGVGLYACGYAQIRSLQITEVHDAS